MGAIAIVAIFGFFAVMGIALAVAYFQKPLPPAATYVVITGIFPVANKYRLVESVTYRSRDGLVGSSGFGADEVRCKVGDTVRAFQTGVSLSLAEGSCR